MGVGPSHFKHIKRYMQGMPSSEKRSVSNMSLSSVHLFAQQTRTLTQKMACCGRDVSDFVVA